MKIKVGDKYEGKLFLVRYYKCDLVEVTYRGVDKKNNHLLYLTNRSFFKLKDYSPAHNYVLVDPVITAQNIHNKFFAHNDIPYLGPFSSIEKANEVLKNLVIPKLIKVEEEKANRFQQEYLDSVSKIESMEKKLKEL